RQRLRSRRTLSASGRRGWDGCRSGRTGQRSTAFPADGAAEWRPFPGRSSACVSGSWNVPPWGVLPLSRPEANSNSRSTNTGTCRTPSRNLIAGEAMMVLLLLLQTATVAAFPEAEAKPTQAGGEAKREAKSRGSRRDTALAAFAARRRLYASGSKGRMVEDERR